MFSHNSDTPNMQNIPVRTELGRMIRKAFIAGVGNKLMQFDFSQLELRVAADLSNDPLMLDIFHKGEDYHQRTAELVSQQVWGIPPEQVKKDHRSQAKTINFRTLYGGSDYANSKALGISIVAAKTLREAIFGRFNIMAKWFREQLTIGRRTGYAWTWWGGHRGRRRSLWQIGDSDEKNRGTAERSTGNTPIQGTASDYCLASVIALVNWIEQDAFPGKLVGTVHDSVLLEVPEDCVEEAAYQIPQIMTQWRTKNNVPLVVDIEIGDTWGELIDYEKWVKGEA